MDDQPRSVFVDFFEFIVFMIIFLVIMMLIASAF